jgi:hypothetical protein
MVTVIINALFAVVLLVPIQLALLGCIHGLPVASSFAAVMTWS